MSDQVKISVVHADASAVATPLLALQLFERDHDLGGSAAELDERTDGVITRVLKAGDFKGKKDETLVLYPPSGSIKAERILLVGVGKREEYTLERLRRGVGSTVRQSEKLGVRQVALLLDHVDKLSERMGGDFAARGAVDAGILASWDFRELKSRRAEDPPPKTLEQITLVARTAAEKKEFERAAEPAAIVARAANFARDLQTRPGNELTPSYLAEVAEKIGSEFGLKVTVLDREQMEKEGMGALLAVARGSQEEPRFIALEYTKGPKSQAPLVLIGKGVTFDSGGISISRPSAWRT
jgi:leucyl aminopeptidase